MKGSCDIVKQFNAYLVSLEAKLYDAHYALIKENEIIAAGTLKNKYTGASDRQRMLVPIFQKHNEEIAVLVPNEFSAGTLERYKTSLSHTVEFMQWKFNVADIDIRNINHAFTTDYDFFLRSVRKCTNNTTVKYIKNFKKIIRICSAHGWLDKDPFAKYKARVK